MNKKLNQIFGISLAFVLSLSCMQLSVFAEDVTENPEVTEEQESTDDSTGDVENNEETEEVDENQSEDESQDSDTETDEEQEMDPQSNEEEALSESTIQDGELFATSDSGKRINAYYDSKTKKYYFFMMNSDDKNLTISYLNKDNKDSTVDVSFSDKDEYVIEDTSKGSVTVVFKQSNIPSLYISLNGTTLDQIHADKNIKYPGNSVVIDDKTGGNSLSAENVEMKGRGNSSWDQFDKKGYQIKFDKKTSVLGMEKAKKWCLIANSSDDSLLRNYVAFNLANALDMPYSIDCRYVDLWVDGDYLGNYLVTEKVEIGSNRVNLVDDNGILAEWDDAFYKREEYWFECKELNAKFTVKDTVNQDPEHIKQTMTSFSSSVSTFANMLSNTAKSDITLDTLSKYIDVESFTQYYLINEYLLNEESVTTSFYWYKDGDNDVLHLGPVWDFDSCMNYYGSNSTVYIYQRNIFNTLLSIPAYKQYINSYYSSHKQVFDSLSGLASQEAEYIRSSVDMNYIRWDVLGKTVGKNGYKNHSTWDAAVKTTTNWLSGRKSGFSIPNTDGFDFVLNKNKDKMTIRYYPTGNYSSIRFAVWSTDSNQADLKWYNTTKEANGSFSTTINLYDFQNIGNFTIHVYSGSTAITANWFSVESLPGAMYRVYNPNSGEHFYTASAAEKNNLVSLGWVSEGIGWYAPDSSDYPVYRLYNANGGEHHYTMQAAEKDMLVKAGWSYEGIGWYSANPKDKNSLALYREYNPNAFANNHNYTLNSNEHTWLLSLGWKDEGKAWYAVDK